MVAFLGIGVINNNVTNDNQYMFLNNYIAKAYYRIYEAAKSAPRVILTEKDCKEMQTIINKAYAEHAKKKLPGDPFNSIPKSIRQKVNEWIKLGRPKNKEELDKAVEKVYKIKSNKKKAVTKPKHATTTQPQPQVKIEPSDGDPDNYDIGLDKYLAVQNKINAVNAEKKSLDAALKSLTPVEKKIRAKWNKIGKPRTPATYAKAIQFVNAHMIDKLSELFLKRAASIELKDLTPEELMKRIEGSKTYTPGDLLIKAVIMKESQGDDNAVGDKNLENKAYGSMQIRADVINDLNKYCKGNYSRKDSNNRARSVEMFKKYTKYWMAYDDESAARIWNGGPNGCNKESTVSYWNDVKKNMSDPKVNKIPLE